MKGGFIMDKDSKKLNYENKNIALKVGTQYIIIDMNEVLNYGVSISISGFLKESNDIYALYKGSTFKDSQIVDRIFDSGKYNIKNLSDAKLLNRA